ncbi:MAG: NAD-dependent epimerase/dehydratase family protein [Candidatus Acidiferrales bacterium]
MIKIIVTGRTSFIGRHFVNDVLKNTDWEIYSLERLPVRPSVSTRVIPLFHDLRSEVPDWILNRVAGAHYLIHFAADVSGIKSLADPELSVTTNVLGTFNVLELARRIRIKKFVQVSTGEVVGTMPFPFFADESAPLRPSNPYAASKAAAEALVNAYRVSFYVPSIIVRSMNVFGPGQSLDRFVPQVIDKLRKGQKITCHVGPDGTVGSRCWLHVDKFVSTLMAELIEHGQPGEIYHVVGPEYTNEDVIDILAQAIGLDYEIDYVQAGPSHDLRYALRDTKLGNMFQFYNIDKDLRETACAS